MRGGRTRGRGRSLPPKEEGYAARRQLPGSLSSDASDLTLLAAAAAAVAVNGSPPSKRTRTPKAKSFVLSPSSLNCKHPSVVDPYLPIGHPGHDIPPPDLGGSIVVVPRNFRAAAARGAARDSDKPLLRHNLLLSDIRTMGGTERGCGNCCRITLAVFNRSISVRRPPPLPPAPSTGTMKDGRYGGSGDRGSPLGGYGQEGGGGGGVWTGESGSLPSIVVQSPGGDDFGEGYDKDHLLQQMCAQSPNNAEYGRSDTAYIIPFAGLEKR